MVALTDAPVRDKGAKTLQESGVVVACVARNTANTPGNTTRKLPVPEPNFACVVVRSTSDTTPGTTRPTHRRPVQIRLWDWRLARFRVLAWWCVALQKHAPPHPD